MFRGGGGVKVGADGVEGEVCSEVACCCWCQVLIRLT